MTTPKKEMQLLTAADILGVEDDLEFKDIVVPKWKGTIRLQQLTADESVKMHETLNKPEYADMGMFIILTFSAVDKTGRKIFTLEDIDALRKRSLPILSFLQDEALALNKMGAEAAAALKKD